MPATLLGPPAIADDIAAPQILRRQGDRTAGKFGFDDVALRVEEMPKHLAGDARALEFGNLVGPDHAGLHQRSAWTRLTDPDKHEIARRAISNTAEMPSCASSTARSAALFA